MKKFTKILTLLLVIVTIVACMAGCKPKTDGEKSFACEIVVNSGTATMTVKEDKKQNVVYTCATSGEFLENVLNDFVEKTDFTYEYTKEAGFGIMITAVCGIVADYDKDQTWFALFVGDEFASVGASELNIEDGTIYKIVLNKG